MTGLTVIVVTTARPRGRGGAGWLSWSVPFTGRALRACAGWSTAGQGPRSPPEVPKGLSGRDPCPQRPRLVEDEAGGRREVRAAQIEEDPMSDDRLSMEQIDTLLSAA